MNTKRSEEMFDKACRLIPGGVNSPVRSFGNVGRKHIFDVKRMGSHIVHRCDL